MAERAEAGGDCFKESSSHPHRTRLLPTRNTMMKERGITRVGEDGESYKPSANIAYT